MREIQWLKEAEDELADIINYVLNTHGLNTALRVYDEIIHRIDLLAAFPELGTSETSDSLRFFLKLYLVLSFGR